MATTFLVGDTTVYYTKMKIRQQTKLWPILAKDLGPLVGGLQKAQGLVESNQVEAINELITAAAPALEHIETYLDAFENQTEFDKSMGNGNTSRQKMKLFEDEVLKDPGDVISYISQCINEEFGAFLASSGLKGLFNPGQAENP